MCLFWFVDKPHTLPTWAPMTSVSTRSSGEACLAVVVLTDCWSSEVAKGPQLSLKNCRNRKGKVEGRTHTHSQTDITPREGREARLWPQTFPKNLKEPQEEKVVLWKSWQSKGDRMKEFTGSRYSGIGHSSGCCWLNLTISACERKAHCSCRKALRTGCAGKWKVVLQGKKGPGLKFILKLLSHETHPLLWIWDYDGRGALQFNTLAPNTALQHRLWCVDFQCTLS